MDNRILFRNISKSVNMSKLILLGIINKTGLQIDGSRTQYQALEIYFLLQKLTNFEISRRGVALVQGYISPPYPQKPDSIF